MSAKKNLYIILSFATIYIVWGTTYLAIRLGVETIPPFLMAGVRFVIGGLLIYWIARLLGASKPSLKHWRFATIIGFLLAVGGNGLVTWAEVSVPSGLTALLIAMVPLWVVLIEWVIPRGSKPTAAIIFGLVLGFGGVWQLISPSGLGIGSEIDKTGAFIIVVATISWAIGSVYSKFVPQHESKFVGAGMQMITGGFILLIISYFTSEFNSFELAAVSMKSIWSLLYLITLGSFAFAVYIWLFTVSSPSKIATYAYVNPVIALLLGNIIAGEYISRWTIGCSVVILAAVLIIISSKNKAKRDKEKINVENYDNIQTIRPKTRLINNECRSGTG